MPERICWGCDRPIIQPNCASAFGYYFHPDCLTIWSKAMDLWGHKDKVRSAPGRD